MSIIDKIKNIPRNKITGKIDYAKLVLVFIGLIITIFWYIFIISACIDNFSSSSGMEAFGLLLSFVLIIGTFPMLMLILSPLIAISLIIDMRREYKLNGRKTVKEFIFEILHPKFTTSNIVMWVILIIFTIALIIKLLEVAKSL